MTAAAAPPPLAPRLDRSAHVLVLGAGPAGLFAAKTLAEAGARVTVLEKSDRVGGLAAAQRGGANFYELGVHHLHASDEYVFGEVRRLLGERLIPVEKSALIRYGKRFCRYPLRFWNILAAMGPLMVARCVGGLMLQQARNKLWPREPRNGEEALVQLYGRPLYRAFFADFTARYWGVPSAELAADFIRKKMPRLSAFDGARRLLSRLGVKDTRRLGVESATARETLWYTPTGAHEIYEALYRHLAGLGVDVRLDEALHGLDVADGAVVRARTSRGDSLDDVAFVVSTIPLPALVRALSPPAPADMLAAAASLHYKPLAVFGLLVRRPRVLDALYVYFRDRSYHRIGEPKLSGMRVEPPDHTVLVVEMTAPVTPDDHERQRALVEEICADLVRDGLIAARGDVVEQHFFWHRSAYPIYRVGFEQVLQRIHDFVGRVENLVSTGRQGAFVYPNMHQAMRMGHDAAGRAVAWCARAAATRRRG